MVRRGLEALIDRKSFYRLVEIGIEDAGREAQFGLWSERRLLPESLQRSSAGD